MSTSYKIKVLLCGSAASGKTRVIKRFVKNAFQADYKLTIGVDILTKDVTLRNGEIATLSIWDIGGQKRFEFIRKTFYKGASGAIIVVNLAHEHDGEEMRKWIDEVCQNVPSVSFLIVGNAAGFEADDEAIASNEHFLVQKLNELGMLYCRSDFFEDAILDLAERMVGLRAVPEIPATAIIYTNASTEAREKAIVQDQDEAASCFNEGIAKYHQQQYTEAIASMAKARDLNPKWATTWHFLACFYQHEGELDQAMACCIKALELDPRLAVSLNVEASVHLKRGEFDGTIDCCKKALELDPGLGLSWKLLGHAYSKKNLNDEAIQCFNRALALDPNDVEAWYTLGTLFVKNQDAGEATRCFTKAISLKSDHAPSLRALAEVKREPVKVVQVKAAATTEVSTMEPKAMLPGLAPPFAPYDGVEPYLFVSHAVADRADVYPIIEHLHKEGIRIWFDQGVPSGEAWWDMIDDRIKHCATFMVFLSQNAISEPYILGEIVLAKRRLEKEEIRFIPVFLNPLELPTQIGLIIRNIPPVVNQGSNNRQFMERVLRSIVDAVRLGRRGAKHS